tara:strand:+ start:141 stop:725 length:585 start_codon:yes stop_codon:yes gene_type:complete
MFANDNNEKNIKTYANLLQNIREDKEGIDEATSTPVVPRKSKNDADYLWGKPKNSVHAQAHQHSKVIHTILDRYDPDHPSSRPDGSHLRKGTTELAQLEHHHNKLADIHQAHATLHSIAGNHDAADEHERIATDHRGAAHVSNHHEMRYTRTGNRESHEEFNHYSGRTISDGDEILRDHPITAKMLKMPTVKRK